MGLDERGYTVTDRPSVLIVSHDVVDAKMAGPGIRYWELARVLAEQFRVVLGVPSESSLRGSDGIRIWPYEVGQWNSLAPAVAQASSILLSGDVLGWFPRLEDCGIPLIVDGYDPHTLETLALFAGSPEQSQRHRDRGTILRRQCRAGDFFICASARQRDWWLGLLEASGRINAETYGEDTSLRKLVDIVPYGLPSSPPEHTRQVLKGVWPGIGPDDRVLLWGGGLWQWLDPLTAVRAMALIRQEREDVRLVFPGTRHPNPAVPDMPIREETVQLTARLGLLNRYVFFGGWVPYEDWPNYLLEADVGLSLHFDSVETRLAFRSRVLDYVWAGLPMVVSEGDSMSRRIDRCELGKVVGYGKEHEVAAAVLRLLARSRRSFDLPFGEAQRALTWERAAGPLAEFCGDPRFAPDRLEGVAETLRAEAVDDEPSGELQALRTVVADQEATIAQLQEQLLGYENGRFIRFVKWLHDIRPWSVNR